MKGFRLLAAAMILGGAMAASAQTRELRIGVEGAYPPFSETRPDGSVVGFDIDIANALCEELKARCVMVKQDWDGMIPALTAKRFDAIVASMMITDERKQRVDFTNKYYSASPRLVTRKGGDIKDDTPEALRGKRVGVQRGTISDRWATTFWEPRGVTVVRYAKQDEAYLDLSSGRLDAALQDSIAASIGFLSKPAGANFAFVGQRLFPLTRRTPEEQAILGEGVGIAVRKGDVKLRDELNAALAAIRKNGTYDRIMKRYFEFDIFGN